MNVMKTAMRNIRFAPFVRIQILKERKYVMNRVCKLCGKVLGKYKKYYCNENCRYKSAEENRQKMMSTRKRKESLCWSCDNACGSCSWSKALIPVEGWKATPVRIKANIEANKYITGYIVEFCPEFKQSKRRRYV